MYINNKAVIAKSEDFIHLNLSMLNRHGIITGATGTGKTTTLKVIAESLSKASIPTVITDIKGDLTGFVKSGALNDNLSKRLGELGIETFEFSRFPTRFWDVFGNSGHPLRITISDLGPILLTKIFNLSEAQEGILNIAFRIADQKGWELIDLKDLQGMLQYIMDNQKDLQMTYGNINQTSLTTIIRKLLNVENEHELSIFGEPNLDIKDLMLLSEESGNGYINVIECKELVKNPTIYATFLVWMLSTFYEKLPEVGDLDKPKVVLFIDEAHLIFEEMNDSIIKKLTQIIKLIRSKGVSVFFISQLPTDIPDAILNQLGNRIQHGLHAYTPKEIRAVKLAADTFRENPKFKTDDAILHLGIGETLISLIDDEGRPQIVEKAIILPPQSLMGEISKDEMQEVIRNGIMESKYREGIDRNSAYEETQKIKDDKDLEKKKVQEERDKEKKEKVEQLAKSKAKKAAKENESIFKKQATRMANSAVSSMGRQLGSTIMRGILGTVTSAISKKK